MYKKKELHQVKLYGLGGQGVVTASKLLASVAACNPLIYSQSIPAYGMERRGAPVYGYCRIGSEPIRVHSFITNPDIVMVYDMAVMQKGVDILEGVQEETILIINDGGSNLPNPLITAFKEVWSLNATEIAIRIIKKRLPGAVMMGALSKATGLISLEHMAEVFTQNFNEKLASENSSAAKEGFASVHKINVQLV